MAIPNTIDKVKTEKFERQLAALETEMETKKGEYMAWCKGRRERIKEVYEAAADAGIPRRPFKAARKSEKLHRQADAVIDDLEADDIPLAEMLAETLGDLGQAVLDKARAKRADADLRGTAQKKRDAERKAEAEALDTVAVSDENAQRITDGIKELKPRKPRLAANRGKLVPDQPKRPRGRPRKVQPPAQMDIESDNPTLN